MYQYQTRVEPGQVEVRDFAGSKDEAPDGERIEGPASENLGSEVVRRA
jgi:hypothetical protein